MDLLDRINSIPLENCYSAETIKKAINKVNDLKKENDKMIKCPVCGKECKNEVAMANCILADDEIKRFNAEKEQQEKLNAEKQIKREEIQTKYNEVKQLIEDYKKEYHETLMIKSSYYNPFDLFNILK